MPVVPLPRPGTRQPQPQAPQPDPSFLLMAAGLMHREGKLTPQTPQPPAPAPTKD